jgi:hypothetical protein
LRIIASANQRADAAAVIVDRHHRAFQIRHRRILAVFRRMIIRLQWMIEIRLMLDLR